MNNYDVIVILCILFLGAVLGITLKNAVNVARGFKRLVARLVQKEDKTNNKLHNINKTLMNRGDELIEIQEEFSEKINSSLLEVQQAIVNAQAGDLSPYRTEEQSWYLFNVLEKVLPFTRQYHLSEMLTALDFDLFLANLGEKFKYSIIGGNKDNGYIYRFVGHIDDTTDIDNDIPIFYLNTQDSFKSINTLKTSRNWLLDNPLNKLIDSDKGNLCFNFKLMCKPEEYDVKNKFIEECKNKSLVSFTQVQVSFKKSSFLHIPTYIKGEYLFIKRLTNVFSDLFNTDINGNYNNFNIKLGNRILSVNPAQTFDYMFTILKNTNNNILMEGPPGIGKTSWSSMLKSKLSLEDNIRVFSLDANMAGILFSKDFSTAMSSLFENGRFDKSRINITNRFTNDAEELDESNKEEEVIEQPIKNIFFIEDGEALFGEIFKDGKKTTAASAILDMLDGETKKLYNLSFVISSNTPITEYPEVIISRFPKTFTFTPLSYSKAIAKINTMDLEYKNDPKSKFYIDPLEVEVFTNKKEPISLREIYTKCRKSIGEKDILFQFEEKLLNSNSVLNKLDNMTSSEILDSFIKESSLEEDIDSFKKSVNIENSHFDELDQ